MALHSRPRIALIVTTFVVYVLTVFFNIMSTGPGVKLGLFLNSTNVVSDKFYLEITPAGWTFSIWGLIYVWQALWLLYALAAICRLKVGCYLYQHPVLPPALFLIYSLNQVCNVTWLFLWDAEQLGAALFFIALTPLTLYACLALSLRRLELHAPLMLQQGMRLDVWLVRLLLQNGLGLYAGWVSLATLLNLAMVLVYDAGAAMATTCGGVLVALAVLLLAWLLADLLLLDRFTRYLVTPYLILAFACSGILARNFDQADVSAANSGLMAADQALTLLALACKTAVTVVRHCKDRGRPDQQATYQPTV